MAIATGALRELAYVKESEYGTTPQSPTMQLLRNTGIDFNLDVNELESEEQNGDRQDKSVRSGNRSSTGTIPFEFSYDTYDDLLAAVMCSDWNANVLKIGKDVPSFTFEDRLTNINKYLVHTGVLINQFQLQAEPGDTGAYISGQFDVLGKDMQASSSELAAPDSTNDNQPFSTCDAKVKIDNSDVLILNSVEFTVNNNIDQIFTLGNCSVYDFVVGKVDVTGTIGAIIEDTTYIQKFIDEENLKLELTLTDLDDNKYTFTLPKIHLSTASISNDTGALNQSIDFRAIYNDGDGSTLLIEREDG